MSPAQAVLRSRIFAIALAIAAIFWLPVEDTSTLPAQFLGLMGAVALGLRVFPMLRGRRWQTFVGWGLACGLVVSPLAAGLMLVKLGLHSHGSIPDFSPEDFLEVLLRTPVFVAGGAFIATGLYALDN